MKTERILLSIVAVIIGILVAGGGFLIYQYSQPKKTATEKQAPSKTPTLSPSPSEKNTLTLSSPKDEEVVTTAQITISGKTHPNSVIVVSTDLLDTIINPSADGSFSAKLSLDSGENLIEIVAIASDGQQEKQVRTVTYSTESF